MDNNFEEIMVDAEWKLHILYQKGKPNQRTIMEHRIDDATCGLMRKDVNRCGRCNAEVSEKIIKALPMLVNRRMLAR